MRQPLPGDWNDVKTLTARRYRCGYCGAVVASDRGWHNSQGVSSAGDVRSGELRVCPLCNQPTYVRHETGLGSGIEIGRVPRALPGAEVKRLPEDVEALYVEARRSHAAEAFTAAVLALRKLLMHVAVEKGSKEDQRFIEYVEYLDEHHYLGQGGKPWVDLIRKRSNEANHEIILMEEDDSDRLMKLAEMLLRLVYEFPGSLEPEQ
jgi:hypothetical protein